MTIQYFAYGSNMLAERLRKRCHSAQFVGVASVQNTTLNFSKLSKDQSGKASFEEAPGRVLFGAVYELEGTELIGLDKAEGVGSGYDRTDDFVVEINGGTEVLRTISYRANSSFIDRSLRPYDWYLDLVIAGARQVGLPIDYVAEIENVSSIPDPDCKRAERLRALNLLTSMTS